MPITSSAKKALRASKKKQVFNIRRKTAIDRASKAFAALVTEKKAKEAGVALQALYKALDTWDTTAIQKAIAPLGWVSIVGTTSGQVPKDTGDGATSGAPAPGGTGGVSTGAPVKIAGVKVGEVENIVLDATTYDAVATLRISRAAGDLPSDSSAAIYTSGLLGERYVVITPGGAPDALADGGEIALTQSAIVLEQLIGKYMFGTAGKAGPAPDTQPSPAPAALPESK